MTPPFKTLFVYIQPELVTSLEMKRDSMVNLDRFLTSKGGLKGNIDLRMNASQYLNKGGCYVFLIVLVMRQWEEK
jgi:hypothetical protein